MAGLGGSPSDSEDEDSQIPIKKRIAGTSFSIDTLLGKPETSSRIRWERILQPQSFFTDFPTKQICPVPPNILVPRNLFHRTPSRRGTSPKILAPQPSDLPDSSDFPQTNNFQEGTTSKGTFGEVADSTEEVSDRNLEEEMKCSSLNRSEDAEPEGAAEEDGPRYKKKRPRTAFSVPQIRTLESEFERNRYLTGSKRKELSKQLKLSETQIKIWFQNRRTKLKRKNVSEMETWVQQLYSPLGPMAPRPLVIGDQLYLFNNPGTDRTLPPPCLHVHPSLDVWRGGQSWS